MRIALFTDTYFPQINGVATSTRALATELRKQGHKVYIFTSSDPAAKTPEFDVFRLPSVAFIFLKSHRASIMYSPKAISMIKKMNLDIIHTQTEFSLGVFGKIASLRLKIPQVHTFHTMYPDYVHYIANGHLVTPKMAQRFSRFCCNVSSVIIAPTEKVRTFLSTIGVRKEINIISTGIDFEAFKRENFTADEIKTKKEEIGIPEGGKVIVVIGRVAKEKSMDVIVSAMPEVLKKIPDAVLVIVGDGPAKRDLMDLAESLKIGERVVFTGAKPWSEIGLYYAVGDVFANASVSEAQGLTFIESMAAGTPVIAKYDPCLDGVIENNKTGFLFEQNESLPDVIVAALSNPMLLSSISKNAYESVQRFSADSFAKNVFAVYERVLAEHSAKERRPVIKVVIGLGKKLGRKIRKENDE